MKNYRCRIRTMDEVQKQKLESLCNTIGIDIEISEIQPVGQPSSIDEALFREKHAEYTAGILSAQEIMSLFTLSRSGFYKKLKVLKLPTATEVKLAKQVKTKQTSQPSVPESITLEDLQNTESFLDLIEQTQETNFGLSKEEELEFLTLGSENPVGEEDDDFQLEADN